MENQDTTAKLIDAQKGCKPTLPAIDYDAEHDVLRVVLRPGRSDGVIVDEYLTVFENDEGVLTGIQLCNVKKIRGVIGLKGLEISDQGRGVSLIRLVLFACSMDADGVELTDRERKYLHCAVELNMHNELEVPVTSK